MNYTLKFDNLDKMDLEKQKLSHFTQHKTDLNSACSLPYISISNSYVGSQVGRQTDFLLVLLPNTVTSLINYALAI